MKKLFAFVFSLIIPSAAFATTELIQIPGDWLDRIATSSVPLLNSLWTPVLFLAGITLVGWVISLFARR